MISSTSSAINAGDNPHKIFEREDALASIAQRFEDNAEDLLKGENSLTVTFNPTTSVWHSSVQAITVTAEEKEPALTVWIFKEGYEITVICAVTSSKASSLAETEEMGSSQHGDDKTAGESGVQSGGNLNAEGMSKKAVAQHLAATDIRFPVATHSTAFLLLSGDTWKDAASVIAETVMQQVDDTV